MKMKIAVFKYAEDIDPNVLDDLLELTKYLITEFNVYITTGDAYNFWRRVSNRTFDCDWLTFTSIRESNKKAIVAKALQQYCIIK